MVYRAISHDLKDCAVWLLDNDYMTEEVSDLLGVSRASLYRWKANQCDYGRWAACARAAGLERRKRWKKKRRNQKR
ncbi:hypothetical protein DFH09DRAFT_945770 [Mycena vulgaris]|nr:hypothetical protein DFH09DRAFT_945770 [Mycena vulgaris]